MDVLLVDDHPIIHETLRAMVRSLRPAADFHSQFDLDAGLSEARRLERLELVLLDLGLPGCSGMDALVRFRKAVPNARAVFRPHGGEAHASSACAVSNHEGGPFRRLILRDGALKKRASSG